MRHYSHNTFFALCLFTIFLVTTPFAAQVAVVVLKNGDRITDRIVKMEKRRLAIDPPFSDILKIKWGDVQSITSERPISVKLYREVDLPENAGEQRPDQIIRYTFGEDGSKLARGCVRDHFH